MLLRFLAFFILAAPLTVTYVNAQGEDSLGVIPKPVSMKLEQGAFSLTASTRILASPGMEGEAAMLRARLKTLTGLEPGAYYYKGGQVAGPAIVLDLDRTLKPQLGDEGYQMSVQPNEVRIKAPTAAGIFYGGITLAQLVSPAGQASGNGISIPCLEITDYPRFAWRGMMLDCSRHFRSKAFIERFLDLLALQKMNHFHWHLVDSEGWRLEIKKYPKLVEISGTYPSSYPGEDPNNRDSKHAFSYGKLHGGGYYSQADVREIVAYAAARHISIMPEIEFPGHSMAALMAYPQFSTTGKPPGSTGNISGDLYNVDDKSMQFLRDVLTEVMELFPGKFIHFGGDEAPKGEWNSSPYLQAKIKKLGLKDSNALQSWLFEQMAEFVAKNGRRAVGWQEITEGGVPKSAIVMPWTGMGAGFKAVENGNDIIVATTSPNYFDSYETDSPLEPAAYYHGSTLAAVYNQTFDYAEIKPADEKHILGAQAQLWGELMPNPENIEIKAFPRSAALAEALWTPLAEKNFDDFSARLKVMAKRWDRYSPPVNYHYLTPPPFAHWTQDLLQQNHGVMEFPITATEDIKALAAGKGGAIFQYNHGGQGLDIQKVELIAGGRVIASDAHEGFTGNEQRRNLYFLNFAPQELTSPVQLRVTTKDQAAESFGDITLMTGKVLAQYEPVNYPLGTVPLGYWQGSDLGKPISIELTGAIRKAGPYQLELRDTDGKDSITVRKVRVKQNGVEIATLSPNVSCGPDRKSAPISIPLDNIDPSKPIALEVTADGGSDTNGEFWVTKMVKLEADATYKPGAAVARWKPETLAGDGFVIANVDLPAGAVSKSGTYHLLLQYTGGGCAAEFKNVKLLANGVVVASDLHDGDSGNGSHQNEYTLALNNVPAGATYSIQFQIKGRGGSDSNGEVRLTPP